MKDVYHESKIQNYIIWKVKFLITNQQVLKVMVTSIYKQALSVRLDFAEQVSTSKFPIIRKVLSEMCRK